MAKKRIIKIPKTAFITCNYCQKNSKRLIPLDASPQYFDCDKCNTRTVTPITSCCIICAFTSTKCAPSIKMEAKINGLEIRN